ncbi:MAG: LytTR family transcriptional regulator, partial [Clostridia bacterium]|nr:LytTR family transcriptional regulator [Clostridia bacterium]
FSVKMEQALKRMKLNDEPFLIVVSRLGLSKVYLSQIYYITVHGRYVMLHTKMGEFELKKSMKELEKELGNRNFVRGDNSSMVNLRYVTAINEDGAVVNGEIIPYSRNRKKALLDAFTLYLR